MEKWLDRLPTRRGAFWRLVLRQQGHALDLSELTEDETMTQPSSSVSGSAGDSASTILDPRMADKARNEEDSRV